MTTWQVQLWPDGPSTQPVESYRKVEAASGKEAAEKLSGQSLSEHGSNHRLRALVRRLGDTRSPPTSFYAP
jgi:hypothetical protein